MVWMSQRKIASHQASSITSSGQQFLIGDFCSSRLPASLRAELAAVFLVPWLGRDYTSGIEGRLEVTLAPAFRLVPCFSEQPYSLPVQEL